ncbi:MAG: YfhO family protein, partial [Anaerolineae bacterium]|nr:YfhO family protein [Anaerolineae bacterium]
MSASAHRQTEAEAASPPLSGREVFHAALLLIASLLVFYGPAGLGDRALLPTDVLFDVDPLWQSVAPAGYSLPGNHLLSDQVFQFYPWKVFAVRSFAQGILPLWNPLSGAGVPFVGNAQSALFDPFNLVGYVLPVAASYVVTAVLRLLVAGLFTYLFARQIGVGKPGALLAMMAFAHSGPLLVWLGHPHSHVIVWLPAMLWTTERALATRRIPDVLAAGLAIAAQFLGGHPETSFHAMMTWIAYSLYRTFAPGRGDRSAWLPQIARIAGAALLGTLLASVQLLPFVEALLSSTTLADRVNQAAASSGSLWRPVLGQWQAWPTLITAILPQFFGTPVDKSYFYPYSNYIEQDIYLGIVPLALALTAVVRTIRSRTHPLWRSILFFALLSAISLGIATRLPLLNLVNHLPLFDIAGNGRLRMVYAFSASMLAGFGMDGVAQGIRSYRRTALIGLVIIALLSVSLVLVGHVGFVVYKDEILRTGRDHVDAQWGTIYYSRPIEHYYALVEKKYAAKLAQASPRNVVTYLPVLIALIWLVLHRWRAVFRARAWVYAALGLTFLDALLVGMAFHPTTHPEHIFPKPGAVRFLEQDTEVYRVGGLGMALYPNTGMVFGLSDVRAYDTVVPQRYVNLFEHVEGSARYRFHLLLADADSPLLDLMNVKYVLTSQELGGRWVLAYSDTGEVRVYRNRDVLPRAFVVHSVEVVGDKDQSLERITSDGFDFRSRVVLEERPPGWAELPPPSTPATATITRYEPNRVSVAVATEATGLLVLSDTYDRGWKAAIDGQAAPVYAANHAFRAVAVPAGVHQVDFSYEPLSFRVAVAVSLLALGILIGISLALWIRPAGGPRTGTGQSSLLVPDPAQVFLALPEETGDPTQAQRSPRLAQQTTPRAGRGHRGGQTSFGGLVWGHVGTGTEPHQRPRHRLPAIALRQLPEARRALGAQVRPGQQGQDPCRYSFHIPRRDQVRQAPLPQGLSQHVTFCGEDGKACPDTVEQPRPEGEPRLDVVQVQAHPDI